MNTRTYTRTFRAEVTQTRTITDGSLTDEERRILDAWESGKDLDGEPVRDSDVDEILVLWDTDDVDVNALDDWNLTIERIDADEILVLWDTDDVDVNALDDWNLTIERIDAD